MTTPSLPHHTTAVDHPASIAQLCTTATQRSDGSWMATCPSHEDHTPSLHISWGRDRVLLHCYAGCQAEAVTAALGLTLDDLRTPTNRSRSRNGHRRLIARYDYLSASGVLLYQVVRYAPKSFRQRRPDPASPGGWVWNLAGVTRVLYHLPAVIEAVNNGHTAFLCEGEKDCDAVAQLGYTATCNVGGAGKWHPTYTAALRDAIVVIVPDNDEVGRKHAEQVATSLYGVASAVKVMSLPGLADKADITDWIAQGHTRDDLQTLADQTSDWTPGAQQTVSPEAPLPLRRALPPPEPYPLDALGNVLGGMARRLMAVIQAPDALCAQAVLAAATLAVQAHANVILDGRVYPLSGYFLTIAESGERKSSVDTMALAAHHARQKQLHADYRTQIVGHQNDVDSYRKARDEVLKKAQSRAEKTRALATLGPPPLPPREPVLLAQEPTYEGLVKLLQVGQPSLGLFSDEGGRLVGGYAMSEEQQLKTAAGLSELWDGKPLSRVRAGDGTALLYGRRVSMHLMLQPVVAPQLLGNVLLSGQGFLSRCLVAWPTSTAGARWYQAVDLQHDAAVECYHHRLKDILLTPPPPIAAKTENELDQREVALDAAAQKRWAVFHDHIEGQLGEEQPLAPVRAFASKLPEHALRLAGVLALTDDLSTPEISAAQLDAGICLAEFYLSEALRLSHACVVDSDLLLAEKLLAWVQPYTHVSLPMVYQRGPHAIRDASTARRIIATRSPVIFSIPDTAFPYPWADFYTHKTMDEKQLLAALHNILGKTVPIVLVTRDALQEGRYTSAVTIPLLDLAVEILENAEALLRAWFEASIEGMRTP